MKVLLNWARFWLSFYLSLFIWSAISFVILIGQLRASCSSTFYLVIFRKDVLSKHSLLTWSPWLPFLWKSERRRIGSKANTAPRIRRSIIGAPWESAFKNGRCAFLGNDVDLPFSHYFARFHFYSCRIVFPFNDKSWFVKTANTNRKFCYFTTTEHRFTLH